MPRLSHKFLAILICALGFNALPESAGAAQDFSLRVDNAALQIIPGSKDQFEERLHLHLIGGSEARISFSVADLLPSLKGSTIVPLGSTPYSLKDLITFSPKVIYYRNTGKVQNFDVSIHLSQVQIDKVHYGGVVVSAAAFGAKRGQVQNLNEVSTLNTMVVIPKGMTLDFGKFASRPVEVQNVKIKQTKNESLADFLIPDLPGVINHGPAAVVAELVNQSDWPIFSSYTTQWSAAGNQLFANSGRERILLAGQTQSINSAAVQYVTSSNAQVGVLPDQGKVTATLIVQSSLGSQVFKPQVLSVTALIFPWKEWLLNIVLILLLLWFVLKMQAVKRGVQVQNIVWLFFVYVAKNGRRLIVRWIGALRKSPD